MCIRDSHGRQLFTTDAQSVNYITTKGVIVGGTIRTGDASSVDSWGYGRTFMANRTTAANSLTSVTRFRVMSEAWLVQSEATNSGLSGVPFPVLEFATDVVHPFWRGIVDENLDFNNADDVRAARDIITAYANLHGVGEEDNKTISVRRQYGLDSRANGDVLPIGRRAEFHYGHRDAYGGWEAGYDLRYRPYEIYALDAPDGGDGLGNVDNNIAIDVFHELSLRANSNTIEFSSNPDLIFDAGAAGPNFLASPGNGVTTFRGSADAEPRDSWFFHKVFVVQHNLGHTNYKVNLFARPRARTGVSVHTGNVPGQVEPVVNNATTLLSIDQYIDTGIDLAGQSQAMPFLIFKLPKMFSFGMLYSTQYFGLDDFITDHFTLYSTWNKDIFVDFEIEPTDQ